MVVGGAAVVSFELDQLARVVASPRWVVEPTEDSVVCGEPVVLWTGVDASTRPEGVVLSGKSVV